MFILKMIVGISVLVGLFVASLASLYSLEEDEDGAITQAKCDTLNDMMSL